MHSGSQSSNAVGRCLLLITTGALTVALATGCRDYLAPEPPANQPDWVIEVGRKATAPLITSPKVSSDSTDGAAADPDSSAISR
ncbi:MAG TPA: hypothetical protein VH763_05005 [Gemmatimonadales bacterium]|jgi:hypothetical protein